MRSVPMGAGHERTCGGRAGGTAADHRRQRDRHDHRVLRFLRLRDRRRLDLPAAVLSQGRRDGGAAGLHGRLWRRLCRASHRLHAVRSFRRPRRTKSDIDRLAAADGARHFRRGPAAALSHGGPAGAGAAGVAAVLPGPRARRRMVRRRSARRRNRRAGPARQGGDVAAARRPLRLHSGERLLSRPDHRCSRSSRARRGSTIPFSSGAGGCRSSPPSSWCWSGFTRA